MPEKPEEKNQSPSDQKPASATAPKPTGKLEGEDLDATADANPEAPASASAAAKPTDKDKPKESLFSRIRHWKYLYMVIFAVLILLVGGVVGASFMFGRNTQDETKPQDLSADQLADLAASSTIVGDPQEILSIRSSAVFEGQVLARNDLDVAGSLKVGGQLSLPSIDVGTGVFDKLQVDTDLAVAGNLTLQGGLTVNGSTSFQTLSAGTLNATNLSLNGDLTINRHLLASGANPGKTNGSALGGGGTASVSGSDIAGTIAINTGNGPPAGCFVSIDFVNDFNGNPAVIVSPVGSASGTLDYYVNRTSSGFSLCTASAPAAGTVYNFDYFVIN